MPNNSMDNLVEFNNCLSEIAATIETCGIQTAYILGDFNAQPGELFGKEMFNFCSDQKWVCADIVKLGHSNDNNYTFISDAHGCKRWLDHCLVTEAAWLTVECVKIHHNVFWSDHFPLEIECNVQVARCKSSFSSVNYNKTLWNERDVSQIQKYSKLCSLSLKNIDFPDTLNKCCDGMCANTDHRSVIDELYQNIIHSLQDAAVMSHKSCKSRKGAIIPGWNKHVKQAHRLAREKFNIWKSFKMPMTGEIYESMRSSKNTFKNKLKYCQRQKEQVRFDLIADQHKQKNFKSFWKETNKLNPRGGLPVSVDGETDIKGIADTFKNHFKVQARVTQSHNGDEDEATVVEQPLGFSAKQVKVIVKSLSKGKAPGHDGLVVEHLLHAGPHIYRVLAMLFTLCIRHTYLPAGLTDSVVVPVIKNKTGDISDKNNYRPISLATVAGKVFDGLLESQLKNHIELCDGQFGFRSGLATDSAILALKQTVKYYVDRKTPVYAAFLDLSKAFDLVCYEKLWSKLSSRKVPLEIVNILRLWYSSQKNRVRWADTFSDPYGLDCGVRQGGLSSPLLFNLYMDQLIDELSKSNIGCSIDGCLINNLSYADDMVLLSPSIKALRRLLGMCESYAASHGLTYNVKKSELLVFNARGISLDNVPPVTLNGTPLERVKEFKYLGHLVTEDLSDDKDLERERRALSVRCNMLARRFARCTKEVKVTLFKAYCQSFYTCSLWVRYTQRAYNDLRIQYNNAFRVLMGLPRFCSASRMFAEGHVDDFFAIMRKRAASMWHRMRVSPNSILKALSDKMENPFIKHWLDIHLSNQRPKPPGSQFCIV